MQSFLCQHFMYRVLIVEDHPLFCQALVQVVRSILNADTCLVSSAEEGLAHLAGDTSWDLVIMDLGLPGELKGTQAVSSIRRCTDVPILVVSGNEDPLTVRDALAVGANAYLAKTASTEMFAQTLRPLLGAREAPAPAHRLTGRQREILGLLCEGLSNKEIGRKLDLSDATVKMHMTAVLRAMGVSTRTQAALAARAQGLNTL